MSQARPLFDNFVLFKINENYGLQLGFKLKSVDGWCVWDSNPKMRDKVNPLSYVGNELLVVESSVTY